MATQTKKCKYCQTAISPEPTDAGAWYHNWSSLGQCKSVATRKLMQSYATPRPEK